MYTNNKLKSIIKDLKFTSYKDGMTILFENLKKDVLVYGR